MQDHDQVSSDHWVDLANRPGVAEVEPAGFVGSVCARVTGELETMNTRCSLNRSFLFISLCSRQPRIHVVAPRRLFLYLARHRLVQCSGNAAIKHGLEARRAECCRVCRRPHICCLDPCPILARRVRGPRTIALTVDLTTLLFPALPTVLARSLIDVGTYHEAKFQGYKVRAKPPGRGTRLGGTVCTCVAYPLVYRTGCVDAISRGAGSGGKYKGEKKTRST